MQKTLVIVLGFIILILSNAIVWAMPVPDTGQSKCYDTKVEIPCPSPGQPFYGQDGNYTINSPSYTKLDGSGSVLPDSAVAWSMVKDNVTGLIWENKTDDGSIHDKDNKYLLNDSKFIDTLNSVHFGGYTDWRLPTIKELASIVDINKSTPYPEAVGAGAVIDTGYFPNTISSYYLSSTTNTFNSAAWGIFFYNGYVTMLSESSCWYVRAVRGGQSGSFDAVDRLTDDVSTVASTYTDNGDGTVTDTSTDLMWQQVSSSSKTWKEALVYCEGLNLGGHTDWRLPNIKELQSLVDYSLRESAITKGLRSLVYSLRESIIIKKLRRLVDYSPHESIIIEKLRRLVDYSPHEPAIIKELRSLFFDYDFRLPKINSTYFPNTDSFFYWSSTTCANYGDGTSAAWGVTFSVCYDNDGDDDSTPFCDSDNNESSNKSLSHSVRAVRGGQPQ